MQRKTRRFLIVLLFVLLGIVGVFIGRKMLVTRLEQAISEKILLLNKRDLHISYDTLYVNWSYNEITAEKIIITKDMYDTTCLYPEAVTAERVRINGFNILSYLFEKNFNIDQITVESPHIRLNKHSKLFSADSVRKKNDTDAIVNVGAVSVKGFVLTYLDSGSCQLRNSFQTNATLSNVSLVLIPGQRIAYALSELRLDSSKLTFPQMQYEFTIRNSTIDLNNRTISVDTARINPLYNKIQFGKELGYEMDRFEGVIPYVKLNRFRFEFEDTLAIAAEAVEAQMFLKVFRDKRLPDRNVYKKLPMEALRSCDFGIQFDTVSLKKSYVSYQEASPEIPEGFTTSFDNLEATILTVSNGRESSHEKTFVKASSNINGQGSVHIECVMPQSAKGNYFARGVVKNVSMTKFNNALEPIANIKVESGKLEELSFKFYFNNVRADGDVTVEYKDLRLTSLRDDKEIAEIIRKNKWTKKDAEEYKVNPFKSFLLNTFVIKKDLDEKNADGVRNGVILFYRNSSKSIFNYLWKSVFSGVKNAYNIDKLQAKQEERKEKKEKRKERRRQKNS